MTQRKTYIRGLLLPFLLIFVLITASPLQADPKSDEISLDDYFELTLGELSHFC